jgi:predicted nucleic acid-binding protein
VPDLVIDASLALAWGMPDESSSYAIAALAAVEPSIMYVPDLWAYEVANGLVIALRRQRITQADVQTFTAALSRLRLRVSRPETLSTIRDGTASAIKFGLSD